MAWTVFDEASWALHNILARPHSGAVLLRAGAVDFIAGALAHPDLYRIAEADDFVKRLTECVAILLKAGSTERDEAYIEHGGPPSNEYLAAIAPRAPERCPRGRFTALRRRRASLWAFWTHLSGSSWAPTGPGTSTVAFLRPF
jgi:hypothetical protein